MDINQRKEQFSIAFARAVAASAGINITNVEVDDDSVDIGFAARGFIGGGTRRSPKLDAQLKCTHGPPPTPTTPASYQLKKKNYDDLKDQNLHVPRILIVLFVPQNNNDWLSVDNNTTILKNAAYWKSLRGMEDIPSNSKTLEINAENLFDVDGLRDIMEKICREENL